MSAAAVPAPRAAAAPSVPRALPWTAFHVAVVLMLLNYVWRVQDLFPTLGKMRFTILVSLAALALAAAGPIWQVAPRLAHPVYRWVLVILGLGVLSVPGGVWPGFSFRFLVDDHIKTVLFTTVVIAAIRTVHDVERLVTVHVVGAALYCVMILTRFEVNENGRLAGLIYYDANDLGMLVVCTIPLVVYLARPGCRPALRLLAIPVLLLFMATVARTGSRGGFLGLLAVLAVLLFTFDAVPRARRMGVTALMVVALGATAGARYWENMSTLLRPQEDYNWSGNNSTGRLEVWKRGMSYMLQRPVLGVGVNAFPMAEGMISDRAALQELGHGMKWSAAHNSFVQIGAELGFPGLAAFLALLAAAFRVSRGLGRSRGPRGELPDHAALGQALTATLVGYCVAGFFLSQAYSAYLYSIFGLLVGLAAVAGTGGAGTPDAAPAAAPTVRRPLGRGGLVVGATATSGR